MNWHDPLAFLLLIPLIGLIVYQIFFSKKTKGAFFYSSLAFLRQIRPTIRSQFDFLPSALKIAALFFVIIALARPQKTDIITNQTQEGVDIMLVMDISLSMLVEDMGMTRLSASKKVVQNFIESRPGDRMGLIVFSGESFTKVPVTFDHELLKGALQEIQPLSTIKSGTAIGLALANAVQRLKSSPPDSRIIIFLTDGENNTGFIDPETALQIVRANKIKVYTIGLGSESGTFPVKYRTKSPSGKVFYQRLIIKSRINKELMQRISDQTGGRFFMAKDMTSLQKVFQSIDKMETYEIQVHKWTKYEEFFQKFAVMGALLYLLSTLASLTVFFRGI